uniref:Uromodulin-like n=1 Tax=Ciona intestinalis TaxID=7719 RepID=F6R1E8_CIOIN|nr:uromodulin-like [Ciona intestinalis]XP_026696620.1 uromodulin-like [Ciona intestinalis]|eukprot:XP_002126457.1 uromodulin-like [Ciona intestinalis]
MKFWLYTWVLCLSVISVKSDYRGVTLSCNPESIRISFSDEFLIRNNIDITSASQLHFDNHQQRDCASERLGQEYTLTLYPPYNTCGSTVQHDTGDYVYSNSVVFTTSSSKTLVMNLQCQYEDRYVVSSNVALTPYVRTLNFITGQGNLSMQINLYQRKDYHPKSKLGQRPSVLVGVPVYVSVDMDDVFGDDSIVTSLSSCYATTASEFEIMENYHYLITGKCASPTDQTVKILSNGMSRKSRFSFEMFRWRNSVEYIYLHCEVKVCNRTSDVCSGSGSLCNGVAGWNDRRKRDVDSNERDSVGNTGYTSLGPILMGQLSTSGKAKLETTLKEIPQNNKYITAYIFGSLAVALAIIGIALVVAFVTKHRIAKNNKALSKVSTPTSSRSNYSEKHLPGLI